MTERYLLNELAETERDTFEEHFFDCPECALDIAAAHQFVEHTKVVMADDFAPSEVPVRTGASVPDRPGFFQTWLAWMRPAFAVPALACLLVVAGYQDLALRSALRQPRILPAVSVSVGSWGGQPTAIPDGDGLILNLRIPQDADAACVRYTVNVTSPSGQPAGSFTVIPSEGQDLWNVTLPVLHREAGSYTMTAQGVTATGKTKDFGPTSFQLQIQR